MTRATVAALVVELQTEELPPKALRALANAFAGSIVDGLFRAGLAESASPSFRVFASPRRLGVSIADVRDRADDREVVDKLMPASVGLDGDGRPTAALVKRLEKLGRAAIVAAPDWTDGPDRLYPEGDGKAAAVYLRTIAPGRFLTQALEGIVDAAIARLPIPKRMSYQRYANGVETTVQFVRPAHGLLALFGDDVVPIRALGLDAGRTSIGHRFVGMQHVTIRSADDYEETLRHDGRVIAGFDVRRAAIEKGLAIVAGDDRAVTTDALLDEVTALVEWPAVYRGTFDAAFLDVPAECLILTMQQNQKYFALTDQAGTLVNRFLVVSNIERDDPTEIVGGNERVLRARLADAKFFYDQDRKTRLADRVERLKTVVYHNRLGTQFERMERVERLSGRIAETIGADVTTAKRAARLAKADLVTDMVGEFPELQGLMGRNYALHDGEKRDVALAIEQQYWPRFAGDAVPASGLPTALALADKLETLTGLFGIGSIPTGDKDPFALRRHALGVIRILIERDLRVDFVNLLNAALDECPPRDLERKAVFAALVDFIRIRLVGYLREGGYSTNEVESVVFGIGEGSLVDLPKRLAAVRAFSALPESASLASADKRVRNILGKSGHIGDRLVDSALLTDDAEIALSCKLDVVGPSSERAFVAGDFTTALISLASLKEPIDRFFDEVMVNTDDPDVRANRLQLLANLQSSMNRVANLSKLAA